MSMSVAWAGHWISGTKGVAKERRLSEREISSILGGYAPAEWLDRAGHGYEYTWRYVDGRAIEHATSPTRSRLLLYECTAGWPLRCLRGARLWNASGSVVIDRGLWAHPTWVRPIPYFPIWIGLAADTLFYATILATPLVCAARARRMLRLRGGLCPKCKYPLGESAVCTECGHELMEGDDANRRPASCSETSSPDKPRER